MVFQGFGRISRALGLLGGSAAAAGASWWLSGDLLRPVLSALGGRGTAGLADVTFAEAFEAVCATVLLGSVCWLSVGVALTVAWCAAAALSPASSTTAALDKLTDRGCPRRLRRLVLAGLGVVIGVGGTGPATAHPSGRAEGPGAPGTAAAAGVSGLALPDRTTGFAPTPGAPRAGHSERPITVLVRPSDSLWTIATDLLPPGASDHHVAAASHRLHQANRLRIGADPDLILPGTPLGVPEQLRTSREEHR